ncbi:MAG: DNA polymerase I, partial [Myxococcales bacterium]
MLFFLPCPSLSPVRANDEAVVYLLDVSFFTFRAYYALPELNTSDGVPTNAVHGVATMLERLIRTEEPKHLAACFDSAGKTFRTEIYPDYKANRDEPDDALKTQFPLVRRLIEAMAIPSIGLDGYEADDLLGTLAKKLSGAGARVVIVTGDKDLMQCVSDSVSLYDPVRDKRVRQAEVFEKFGVPPSAVTDVQGLMGDSTDNIPGVKGVGPKTATALIAHFGSLEETLARIEEIEGLAIRGAKSVRKKVEEGAADARLSKRLATVREDLPLGLELDDLI